MYPKEIVSPMTSELTALGFEELSTSEEVNSVFQNTTGSLMLVINSVCGCAAGSARPAIKTALTHAKTPDKLVTVFAGVDKEATEQARKYLLPYPPSSPAIAIFKDGNLVRFLERHQIQGIEAESIAESLIEAFDSYC